MFNSSHLQIEPNSGDILLLRPLTSAFSYTLDVTVTSDSGLASTVAVAISVDDVNDNAPVFAKEKYEYRIREGMLLRDPLMADLE